MYLLGTSPRCGGADGAAAACGALPRRCGAAGQQQQQQRQAADRSGNPQQQPNRSLQSQLLQQQQHHKQQQHCLLRWNAVCAVAALAVLLIAPSAAAAAGGAPHRRPLASPHADGPHRALIERLSRARLPISEHLLAQGYKFEPAPRQWARLTHKLTTPGSTVKIVTFGGSVSVGYRMSSTSYPEQFVEWLRDAFPGVNFELTNMARRATAATFAALCLVQDMPTDADLVIIEYSINGYGGQCQCFTAPQNAGYETLMRRVLKKAPQAAMMSFATFMWMDKQGGREVYYNTGEDQHATIARRYGVPMMSVRDALYDVMFDDANPYGVNRSAILVDIVHVSDHGARLYAGFLSWALRRQVVRMLRHHGRSLAAVAASPPASMIAPLNPDAAQEDWPSFCAEGQNLLKVVAPSDEEDWDWVDEGSNACPGCHKYGYASNEVGAYLDITVNSDVLDENDKKAGAEVMLALSFLKSYSDVGRVRVGCESGCTCKPTVMDGKNKTPTSELHTERMPISPHPQCRVRITIIEETSTKGHKFRLSGVAVHKQDKVMSYMYAPVYD